MRVDIYLFMYLFIYCKIYSQCLLDVINLPETNRNSETIQCFVCISKRHIEHWPA